MKFIKMDLEGPDVGNQDIRERLRTKRGMFGAVLGRFVSLLKGLFRLREFHVEGKSYDRESSDSGGSPCNRNNPISWSKRRPSIRTIIALYEHPPVTAHEETQTEHAVPGIQGVNISPAPDGQPPLAIILNTATFIEGASVPLELMTLGSVLASLKTPSSRFRSLPLEVISTLAFGRIVVMPILGVSICQSLTHVGVIDANNVLRLVCMYVIALPSRSHRLTHTIRLVSCHVYPLLRCR